MPSNPAFGAGSGDFEPCAKPDDWVMTRVGLLPRTPISSYSEATSEIGKLFQLHVDTTKADTDSVAESKNVVKRVLEQSGKERSNENKLIRQDS